MVQAKRIRLEVRVTIRRRMAASCTLLKDDDAFVYKARNLLKRETADHLKCNLEISNTLASPICFIYYLTMNTVALFKERGFMGEFFCCPGPEQV